MPEFTYKWLIWDGSYALRGRCNQAAEQQTDQDSQLLLPVVYLAAGQNVGRPPAPVIVPTGVSVRILKIVESPANAMAIKLQLKRLKKPDSSWNIKSLMVRVYEQYDAQADANLLPSRKLVYQEILRKEQLDLLADARSDDDSGLPQQPSRWAGAIALDGTPALRSPYKIRIWVSTKTDAFGDERDDLPPYLDEPQAAYTVQIHDQYKPTEAEFRERFKLGAGSAAWDTFIAKRRDKERAGKYDDQPGKNLTRLAYRTFVAPAADLPVVEATLREAARLGVPFTEGLVEVAQASAE